MGRSVKYGPGAVIHFSLANINIPVLDRARIEQWRRDTAIPQGRWRHFKWRGKLVARRSAGRNQRGGRKYLYQFHPENAAPPNGATGVLGAETWNNTILLEVPTGKCGLCYRGDAPVANRVWFARRDGQLEDLFDNNQVDAPNDVEGDAGGAGPNDEDGDAVGAAPNDADGDPVEAAPNDADGDADGDAPNDADGDADGDAPSDADSDADGDAPNDADGDAAGNAAAAPAVNNAGAQDGNANAAGQAAAVVPPEHLHEVEYAAEQAFYGEVVLPLENGGESNTEGGAAAAEQADGMQWDAPGHANDRDHVVDPREQRRQISPQELNYEPSLRLPPGIREDQMTEEEVFMHFLPRQWLTDVMIPSMQQRGADMGELGEIRLSHILELLGVYMYFSVNNDMEKFRDLWTHVTDGVFRLVPHPMHRFGVSRRRIERTKRWLGCLEPQESDANHPVKGFLKMSDAFNDHWAQCFIPGHLCCQDESVVKSTSPRDYLRVCLAVPCNVVPPLLCHH